jgi:hypothetical protein
MKRCEICQGELEPDGGPHPVRMIWVHGLNGRDDCGHLYLCEVCATHHHGDGAANAKTCLRCRKIARVVHFRSPREVPGEQRRKSHLTR